MTVDTEKSTILLRTFKPGDEQPFKELNEIWISTDFALEAADHEVLDNPRREILDKGGEICVAEIDGKVMGCCALLFIGENEYELAKMTVASEARGLGIGRKLLQFAIEHARKIGVRRLYLESNTKASDAVHLYEALGFRHLAGPEHASKYARANVFMEMFL
jgi:putative acetyltransferase